jgi:pimeloyl-ACP methyl ester carboxylesterase
MSERVSIDLDGGRADIEYALLMPMNPGPLLVFLHEGLGSIATWRRFPQELCEATCCRGLVYSRPGYGESTLARSEQDWPVDFMHVEARTTLPKLLVALGIDSVADPPVLVGHSDGGSIALIHAGLFPDQVAGVVAMAPHIFVEPVTVESIAALRDRFLASDLSARLGKYHRDIQTVFSQWSTIWLRPEFLNWNIRSHLSSIHCPVLLIQGYDDEYGTMAQIDGILNTVPSAIAVRLAKCGHSPHVDQRERVLDAIRPFMQQFVGAERAPIDFVQLGSR